MQSLHPQLQALSQAAAHASLRHEVLSRNLANVNTPNYKRLEVESTPASNESSESGTNLETAGLRIVTDNSPTLRSDGNNVDIEKELGAIQQNALAYQTVMQLMTSQVGSMRKAIDG